MYGAYLRAAAELTRSGMFVYESGKPVKLTAASDWFKKNVLRSGEDEKIFKEEHLTRLIAPEALESVKKRLDANAATQQENAVSCRINLRGAPGAPAKLCLRSAFLGLSTEGRRLNLLILTEAGADVAPDIPARELF
ncbi:MAG: hypothetical protein RRY12_07180 [Cloacibacillus sp.]